MACRGKLASSLPIPTQDCCVVLQDIFDSFVQLNAISDVNDKEALQGDFGGLDELSDHSGDEDDDDNGDADSSSAAKKDSAERKPRSKTQPKGKARPKSKAKPKARAK